jgi:hypothetical protein
MAEGNGQVRTMAVRDFLRGGYKQAETEPVVVLSGGEVAFVAYPGTTTLRLQPPSNGSPPAVAADRFGAPRPAPKPGGKRR